MTGQRQTFPLPGHTPRYGSEMHRPGRRAGDADAFRPACDLAPPSDRSYVRAKKMAHKKSWRVDAAPPRLRGSADRSFRFSLGYHLLVADPRVPATPAQREQDADAVLCAHPVSDTAALGA